jgi:hypothetical protein
LSYIIASFYFYLVLHFLYTVLSSLCILLIIKPTNQLANKAPSVFTALVPLWAAWGIWYEKRYSQGTIRLEENMNADSRHPDGVLPILEKEVIG